MKTTEPAVVLLQKRFNTLNEDIKRYAKITRFYEQQIKERKIDPDKGWVVVNRMKKRTCESTKEMASLALAIDRLVFGSLTNAKNSEVSPEDTEKTTRNWAILTQLELNVED